MNQTEYQQTNRPNGPPRRSVSLQELILQNTDGGATTVEFLTKMMNGGITGSKPIERLRAAKELLDRCYGKPTAGESTSPAEEPDHGLAEATAILEARINAVMAGAKDSNTNDVAQTSAGGDK